MYHYYYYYYYYDYYYFFFYVSLRARVRDPPTTLYTSSKWFQVTPSSVFRRVVVFFSS